MLDPDRRAYIETMMDVAEDFPDGAFWGFMQEKGIDAEELAAFSEGETGGLPLWESSKEREPVAHARRFDPETSHEAAASIPSAKIRESQREVLHLFERYGPMTDHEAAEVAETNGIMQSPSGLRTRRREVVDRGVMRFSGKFEVPRGKTRRARVWEVVPWDARAIREEQGGLFIHTEV